MVKIFPSLIAADLLNLGKEIATLEPQCDGFHVDVMDFHFVPNLTWGKDFIQAISTATYKPLHIHLMIERVHEFITTLSLKEQDVVIFHPESVNDPKKIINFIKSLKCAVGIALQPKTLLEQTFDLMELVDHVLVMSVNPGFSGQTFLPETYQRLERIQTYRSQHNLSFLLGVDGGITAQIIPPLMPYGVDEIAVATALFSYADRLEALKTLYKASLLD